VYIRTNLSIRKEPCGGQQAAAAQLCASPLQSTRPTFSSSSFFLLQKSLDSVDLFCFFLFPLDRLDPALRWRPHYTYISRYTQHTAHSNDSGVNQYFRGDLEDKNKIKQNKSISDNIL
jgi:hypothetical protein